MNAIYLNIKKHHNSNILFCSHTLLYNILFHYITFCDINIFISAFDLFISLQIEQFIDWNINFIFYSSFNSRIGHTNVIMMVMLRKSIAYIFIVIWYVLFSIKSIDGRVAGKVGGSGGNYYSGKLFFDCNVSFHQSREQYSCVCLWVIKKWSILFALYLLQLIQNSVYNSFFGLRIFNFDEYILFGIEVYQFSC